MSNVRKVLLSASWCGPCQVVKKRIAEQNLEVDIVDVDTEEGRDLATKNGVKSVPTLLVITDFSRNDEPFEMALKITGSEDIIAELKKE